MQQTTPTSQEDPPFLRLPIELRRLIYSFILPRTAIFDSNGDGTWRMQRTLPRSSRETGNDIVWYRGCTALLAVNRKVHEETADMMYGENTFVIDVTFDKINFRYRWRTPNQLTPNRVYAYLNHFSQRNLMRVKNYVVNVESVDDYTGMIKYNCGGRGLAAGIRGRVQELVGLLVAVPYLQKLEVHLIDGAISRVRFSSGRVHRVQDDANLVQSQIVLDPLRALCGVRKAQVTGVSEEYAEKLEQSIVSQRESLLS